MNQDLLTCLEGALRSSIAADSFDDAERLLEWYALALSYDLRVLDPGAPELLKCRERVNDLFEWAAARTKAFRACAATEAGRLYTLNFYDRQPEGGRVGARA
jgi:hypothetical protein